MYYVPDTILNVLYMSIHLIFTRTPHQLLLLKEKMDVKESAQGHMASKLVESE